MAEPSKKAPAIEQFLEEFAGRSSSIKGDTCLKPPIGCGKPVTPESFRDDISRREYSISGLCQECQDKVFPPE